MSDLNDEGRSLFDAARAGYEPSEADRKRVLRGVLLRAGVGVGVTSAASAAGAPLAAGAASSSVAGLAFKGVLWLAIVGSVGVGGYAVSRGSSSGAGAASPSARVLASATSTIRSVAAPVPVMPRAVDVGTSSALSSPARKSDGAHASTSRASSAPREANLRPPESSAASPNDNGPPARTLGTDSSGSAAFPDAVASEAALAPSASSSAVTLSVEARGLAEVQRDLKEGRNLEALRLVEQQRQQFAHGELQSERDAAKIVALCAVGRVAEARAAARTFLANAPRSPFASRIRASCAGQ